jgi:Flp pilus assembly protein TadD
VVGLYSAYLFALALYLLVRLSVVGGLGVPQTFYLDNPLVVEPALPRIATALVVFGEGLLHLVWPVGLSPDYSYNAIPVVRSLWDWRLLATLGVLTLLTYGMTHGGVRSIVRPVAVAWYLIALLPTANLVFPVGTIFGDRLLYLPSVGFCLVSGLALVRLAAVSGGARTSVVVAGSAVAIALAAQTVRYASVWTDDLTLFRWATRVVPTSTRAHHKVGEELLRAGELGDAVRSLHRALAIAPDNRYAAETLALAERTITERYLPDGRDVPSSPPPTDPDILHVLGTATRGRGDLDGAAEWWNRALASDSSHARSHADLGVYTVARGDTTVGMRHIERAVQLDSALTGSWFNLARLRLARGDTGSAADALRQFLAHAAPSDGDRVAWAERTLGGLRR